MSESIKENILAKTYHHYVIKDGKFIGNFEQLYRDFEDPWHQSKDEHINNSRRNMALSWCERLRDLNSVSRVIELGCGFGHLTSILQHRGFSAVGIDVSEEAIRKARIQHPGSVFVAGNVEDFNLLKKFDPDIFIMAEITWYVLDHLEKLISEMIKFKEERDKPVYLIHLLTTYSPGKQQYGRDKFTDLDGILSYFKLNYLEVALIKTPSEDDPDAQGTFFVAKI